MNDTQPPSSAAARPPGNIEYQNVEPATATVNWKAVDGPSNLKNYNVNGVNNHHDLQVIMNNWAEWLLAWAKQTEDRVLALEQKVADLEKGPPGGRHPPPPPPFG